MARPIQVPGLAERRDSLVRQQLLASGEAGLHEIGLEILVVAV
jgi:hypothetical protein